MKISKQLKRSAFFYFIILTSSFFLLLAGCNLAPGYHQPSVQTPPAFKETNAWKLAQPSDGVIKGKWWESFNDPQLNALEEQVAISNQNIAAALENFFAARALVKEARSAGYPTASVDPAMTKSSPARSPNNGIISSYALPLDASWEPDLWDAVRNTVRADAYAAQASAAILENMKLTAQAELAVDYYELRGQDEMIQLFNETVKAYRESVDLTTTLFQTGIDSEWTRRRPTPCCKPPWPKPPPWASSALNTNTPSLCSSASPLQPFRSTPRRSAPRRRPFRSACLQLFWKGVLMSPPRSARWRKPMRRSAWRARPGSRL